MNIQKKKRGICSPSDAPPPTYLANKSQSLQPKVSQNPVHLYRARDQQPSTAARFLVIIQIISYTLSLSLIQKTRRLPLHQKSHTCYLKKEKKGFPEYFEAEW